MTSGFSILHISDLHRSPDDPISNDELVSALVSDCTRYVEENPSITVPQAIIVSGDIIQGVTLGTPDHQARLAEQYAAAEQFLDELVRRFLGGDRSRLVMVPGNHDVDWNTAFASMELVAKDKYPANLWGAIHSESSQFRWDWKNQELYRIADPALYARRLEAFWTFFDRFYSGVPGLLSVKSGADANLFSLCGGRIAVAALNSCHGNDCFAFHGMIRREAIARSHLELDDTGQVFDLRMAIWHHSIEGGPYQSDYMDVDIVRGMIGRGYRLGLHGHQHKAQAVGYQIRRPDQESMAVVSAGSLCAGARDLPTGVYRQYNMLEIAPDFRSVRVHVRAMSVANLFARALLDDFGGASYVDLDWTPPRNLAGEVINTTAARILRGIEDAEVAAKTGDPVRAVALLRSLPLPAGSYERELFMEAAVAAEDWTAIIDATTQPTTIDELMKRINSFMRLGRVPEARETLDRFSGQLQFPAPIAEELLQRMTIEEAMKQ